MKKLLILEKIVKERTPGYDHIFSYVSNPADSFPEDYITRNDAKSVYKDLFASTYQYLAEIEAKEGLVYRDVPLLTCLQKEPFQDLYFIALRLAIFDKVLDTHKPITCDIVPKSEETFGSSLSSVLDEATQGNPSVHLLGAEDKKSDFVKKVEKYWPLFPIKLTLGNIGKCKTMIFSDYKKSVDVLKELDPSETVLFHDNLAARNIYRALKHRAKLYQFYAPISSKRHRELLLKISRSLERLDHRAKFSIGSHSLDHYFQRSLNRLLLERIPPLLTNIDVMYDFLKEAKQLKAAFLDEDITPAKKAFCYIARQYKVETFVETHGVLADRHGYVPVTADRIFVWGQAQKNKLIDWGTSQEKILVSGCSWHDRYKKMDQAKLRTKTCKKLGIGADKRIVLVGFPAINGWRLYFENQRKSYIKKSMGVLLDALEKNPSLHIIIKVRPGDANGNYYYEMHKNISCADQITILEHYNSLHLILISDFVVSFDSTFSVEGFSLGKNVLNLYEGLENLYSEFQPYQAFRNAESPEEFREKLDELIQDPFKRNDNWDYARRKCLNEGNVYSPPQIIAKYLLGKGMKVEFQPKHSVAASTITYPR